MMSLLLILFIFLSSITTKGILLAKYSVLVSFFKMLYMFWENSEKQPIPAALGNNSNAKLLALSGHYPCNRLIPKFFSHSVFIRNFNTEHTLNMCENNGNPICDQHFQVARCNSLMSSKDEQII